MLPSEIGERAEAAVIAALVAAGRRVLLPFGACRYDVAFEEDGKLVKVQCKAGSLHQGAVSFRTHSVGRNATRDYRGDVDYFGVYCHERAEAYLVPAEGLPLWRASLRLTPARNGQSSGIRLATDFVLSSDTIEAGSGSSYIDKHRCIGKDGAVTATPLQLPVLCCAALDASTVSDAEAEATARLFKALADPHRVRIVNLLANAGEAVCVCDITDAIGLSQPTVSFHLKKLTASGLLDREKRSTWAYYSLSRKALDQLADVVKVKGKRS